MKRIIFLFLLTACAPNNTFEELPVSEAWESCKLSDITENVTVIPLDTSDEYLLDQGIVRMDDDLLFIKSMNEIYLFDTNGKFIKQLTRKGNGPGEIDPIGFTLNTDLKQLVAYTYNSISFFDYDGMFLRRIALAANNQCLALSYFDEVFWMKARTIADNNNAINQLLYKYSIDFTMKDSLHLVSYDSEGFVNYDHSDEVSIVNGEPYIHVPTSKRDIAFRDTLYQIDDQQLKPKLRIKYNNLNYQEGGHPMMIGYPIVLSPIRLSNRFVFSPFFEYSSERKGNGLYIYDRTEKQGYLLTDGIVDDLYQTGKLKDLQPLDLSNESFCYFRTGEELESLFPDRAIDDNPVVFIVDLKR